MASFSTIVCGLMSLLNTNTDAQGNSSMQLICYWLGAEQQG